MDDERTPHFSTDFSGRLSFDLFADSAEDFPVLCKAVMTEFRLTQDGELIIGPDQMFWDFRTGDSVVELAWDNWMGFTVTAKTPEVEPLVREIGAWVCSAERFLRTPPPSG